MKHGKDPVPDIPHPRGEQPLETAPPLGTHDELCPHGHGQYPELCICDILYAHAQRLRKQIEQEIKALHGLPDWCGDDMECATIDRAANVVQREPGGPCDVCEADSSWCDEPENPNCVRHWTEPAVIHRWTDPETQHTRFRWELPNTRTVAVDRILLNELLKAAAFGLGDTTHVASRQDVYRMIDIERARQQEKWGVQTCADPINNHKKVAILTEEVGEVARAVLDHDRVNLINELVQVAAVAVAWLEAS